MSHRAHGTNKVYGHASRTREMETSKAPSTLFDELHPHLRNVVVKQQTLAERIHGYLLRRGPRALRQIADKMSGTEGRVQRCLLSNEEMFEQVGKMWIVRSDNNGVSQ